MHPQGPDSMVLDIYPSTEPVPAHDSMSPTKASQAKHVSFELLLPQSIQRGSSLPIFVRRSLIIRVSQTSETLEGPSPCCLLSGTPSDPAIPIYNVRDVSGHIQPDLYR